MSLFIRTTPVRLHKQTWAEKHRFEILMTCGFLIVMFVFVLASLCVQPTIAGVV